MHNSNVNLEITLILEARAASVTLETRCLILTRAVGARCLARRWSRGARACLPRGRWSIALNILHFCLLKSSHFNLSSRWSRETWSPSMGASRSCTPTTPPTTRYASMTTPILIFHRWEMTSLIWIFPSSSTPHPGHLVGHSLSRLYFLGSVALTLVVSLRGGGGCLMRDSKNSLVVFFYGSKSIQKSYKSFLSGAPFTTTVTLK